jgi:hypothetical protein
MDELSDAEWEKQAEEMTDKIVEIIEGKESDMIIEVLACIVADMLEPFEALEGVPLMLEFIGTILEKRYDLGFDVTKIDGGLMQ